MPVESIKHNDKRSNNPTEELRDFVKDEKVEKKLYPRDPSLDPQLVWRGKDEQDSTDLSVPIVPIYVQEQIQPQAIIEDLRAQDRKSENTPDLFAGLNNLEFEDAIDFYKHEKGWANRMICGDSLTAMTSLAEKENLKGKVQMIFIDPPYGIKFGSNWQVSTRKRDVKDRIEDATRQPEQVKAYRDTWELGIHSYLTYLRDRLMLSKRLLHSSGSIFMQISDENVHLVRNIMDEIFGPENHCAEIIFLKTTGKGSQGLDTTNDYLLWYAKNRSVMKYRPVFEKRSVEDDDNLRFVQLENGARRRMTATEVEDPASIMITAKVFRPNPLTNQRPAQGNDLREFEFNGHPYKPGQGTFRTDLAGMSRLSRSRRLTGIGETLSFVRFLLDFEYKPKNNTQTILLLQSLKSQSLIQSSIRITLKSNSPTTTNGTRKPPN
mgnify:CR=1 FL=1